MIRTSLLTVNSLCGFFGIILVQFLKAPVFMKFRSNINDIPLMSINLPYVLATVCSGIVQPLKGNVFTPVCQSFCSRGEGCIPACIGADTSLPRADTPSPLVDIPCVSQHSLGQTPPRADTPFPLGRHPLCIPACIGADTEYHDECKFALN